MLRVYSSLLLSFLVINGTVFAQATKEKILKDLDATLFEIDRLEGYGPCALPRQLAEALALMEQLLELDAIQEDSEALLEALIRKFFSRYPYRDGSCRSRLYAEAQRKATNLLQKSERGKLLMKKLSPEFPLIEIYSTIIS